jgi:hypothetical protein
MITTTCSDVRNTYPTLRPITQFRVSLPTRLERALGALRRPWMVSRVVTFPESALVPLALQPLPICRCGAPLRVRECVVYWYLISNLYTTV